MSTHKYMPDEFVDCGFLGEHPIEVIATVDTKHGCPDTRAHVQIFHVVAIIDIYGPIRVDVTKRILTDLPTLIDLEEQVLKDYLASRGVEEESA